MGSGHQELEELYTGSLFGGADKHKNRRMATEEDERFVRVTFPTKSVNMESVRSHFAQFGNITQFSPRESRGTMEIIIKYMYVIFFEYATQTPSAVIDGVQVRVERDDGEIVEIDEEEDRREQEEEMALYLARIKAFNENPIFNVSTSGSSTSTITPNINSSVLGPAGSMGYVSSRDTPRVVEPRVIKLRHKGRAMDIISRILGSREFSTRTTTVPSANSAPPSRKRSKPDSAASGDAPVSPEDYGYKLKGHDDADPDLLSWVLPPIE